MAIISGVTVRWGLSPRLIILPLAEAEVAIADLQDTLQDLEDDEQGMPFDKLRSLSGGQALDDFTDVGFTMELNNAQLIWQTNHTVLESGTITTPDANGLDLMDSAALFVTNGVVPGDMVVNSADGSHATVLDVVSETRLLVDGLAGGTDGQFDSADGYSVFDWQLRKITGGNAVAVNSSGTSISPVLNSFGNSFDRTSSSSATIQDLALTNIQYLIESLRDDHQGFGEIFYVDPVNGSDGSDGATDISAVQTIQYAHDNLVVSGRNDVINVINKTGAASVVIPDTTLSKDEVHIRGAGRSISVNGGTANGTIFTIDGNSCSIDALLVDGVDTSDYCIVVNGRHFKSRKLWVKQALVDNILIRGGDYHEFVSLETEKAGGAGLALFDAELASGSPREVTVDGASNIYLNDGDGIRLDSVLANPAGTSTRLIRFRGETFIFDNVGYGVNITGNVSGTVIGESVNIYGNTAGYVLDDGLNTIDSRNTLIKTRLGLSKMDPVTDTTSGIDSDSGDIDITRTGDGVTTSTLTRQ